MSKAEALLDLGLNSERPIVGLLPGSRGNEIKRLLPLMVQAAKQLQQQFPRIQFILVRASSVNVDQIQPVLDSSGLSIKVIEGQFYNAIQCCNAVITSSGTATLEVTLLGIPLLIVYRVTPLTYFLGRLLVTIPYIGLPNIIAGRHIIQEYVQHNATAEAISGEVRKILTNHDYTRTMVQNLAEVRKKLGSGGGSTKLAAIVRDMLIES